MTKIDQNKSRMIEINQFLQNKVFTDFNDQRLFAQHREIYFKNEDEKQEQLQGPVTLKDLYGFNSLISQNQQYQREGFENQYDGLVMIQEQDKENVTSQATMKDRRKPEVPTCNRRVKSARETCLKIVEPKLGLNQNFDAHMIQTLFPDRAIKAQNFIDLLACAKGAGEKQKHLLRVQNPHMNKAQDVELAVKQLTKELKERNAKVTIKKLNLKDPFVYQVTLNDAITSAVMPRSARNQFGAPYSHLPKDKTLSQKVKLNMSSGNLYVQKGGGHQLLVDFLEQKGYFYGSNVEE